jgi:hypothetical protein
MSHGQRRSIPAILICFLCESARGLAHPPFLYRGAQDVIDIVAMNTKESPRVLADTLAQAAFSYAADAKRLSPWQVSRGAVVFARKDKTSLHR